MRPGGAWELAAGGAGRGLGLGVAREGGRYARGGGLARVRTGVQRVVRPPPLRVVAPAVRDRAPYTTALVAVLAGRALLRKAWWRRGRAAGRGGGSHQAWPPQPLPTSPAPTEDPVGPLLSVMTFNAHHGSGWARTASQAEWNAGGFEHALDVLVQRVRPDVIALQEATVALDTDGSVGEKTAPLWDARGCALPGATAGPHTVTGRAPLHRTTCGHHAACPCEGGARPGGADRQSPRRWGQDGLRAHGRPP